MLAGALNSVMRGSFDLVVATLGVPMTWQKIQHGEYDFLWTGVVNPDGAWSDPTLFPYSEASVTTDVVGGFRMVAKDDIAIINAYGLEARVITLSKSAISFVPQKFDLFIVAGSRYVVHGVREVYVNGDLTGFKCYVKGT